MLEKSENNPKRHLCNLNFSNALVEEKPRYSYRIPGL